MSVLDDPDVPLLEHAPTVIATAAKARAARVRRFDAAIERSGVVDSKAGFTEFSP
jgi:hypothetical protein